MYHAFIEVCNKVFSGTPRQTIKSRMRALGINLVRCPTNIQEKVRKARPQLASFKVISLITKRDVLVLQAYHQSRAPNESTKFIEVCSSIPFESSVHSEKPERNTAVMKVKRDISQQARLSKLSAFPSDSASSQSRLPKEGRKKNKFSIDQFTKTTYPTAASVTSKKPVQTGAFEIPECPGSGSEDESEFAPQEEKSSSDDDGDGDDDDDDEDSDGSHVGGNLPHEEDGNEVALLLKKRKLDRIPFKDVIMEINQMKTFYTSELNHKRRTPMMTDSTWGKHVERLVTFFTYTSKEFNRKPALALVDDMALVESFLHHLQTERCVQKSTAARYIHSLLISVKYVHLDESRKDYQDVETVHQLRALRGQLEKAQALEKSMPSVKLLWPQFQELVRNLFRKYEEASGAIKARLHMDFTMLLLFSVNPGRGKELRTLRLVKDVKESELQESVKRIPRGDNVIVFSTKEPVWLIEKGFKTFSKYGTNVVEFNSEFQFLTYHLREYERSSRPKLLPREEIHDFFFVNKNGMPFNSSGSFSKYLSRLFKEYLGFPCAVNEIRHALVEHFRSSPESADSRLAESLARVCKHSLRTQRNIYDRRTEPERRSLALRYLNSSAENFILDEAPRTSAGLVADEETLRDDLPSPGEICALVAADATANDPRVLLAKVLKYTVDGSNARLAWLKELESRPNYFAFQVGCDVWEEKSSALIYPVDVIYHRSDGIYELRSSNEQICALART